jgi:addiction module HigA family antidote
MTRMHNPPHPGEVLKAYLGGKTVTEAAAQLGVRRASLSALVRGAFGVTPAMAEQLGNALGTSPALWAGLQLQHDLHQASLRGTTDLDGRVIGAGAPGDARAWRSRKRQR